MIPHLESLIEMNRNGDMPMEEIASYVVKYVAQYGDKSSLVGLPSEVLDSINSRLKWYRQEGDWYVVSNTGVENYGKYADVFMQKVAWGIS